MRKLIPIILTFAMANVGNAQSLLDAVPVEYFHQEYSNQGDSFDYFWKYVIVDKSNGDNETIGLQMYSDGVCGLYLDNFNVAKTIPTKIEVDGSDLQIVSIGKHPFSEWGKILPGDAQPFIIPEGIEVLNNEAFIRAGFTNITFPKSLQEICHGAFASSGLLEVNIPSNVLHLNYSAFLRSENLSKVRLEDGETPLHINGGFYQDFQPAAATLDWPSVNSPFKGCPLVYVYVGRDITDEPDARDPEPGRMYGYTIPYANKRFKGLFEGQAALETIEIGPMVTAIPTKFFWGCTGLKQVVCHAEVPPAMDNSVGFNDPEQCDLSDVCLVVPTGSVEAYKSAAGWKLFPRIADHYEEGSIDGVMESAASVSKIDGTLVLTGCQPGASAEVYALNGMLLTTLRVSEAGTASWESVNVPCVVRVADSHGMATSLKAF